MDEAREALINICSSKLASHYAYDGLAAGLFADGLYSRTDASFASAMLKLCEGGVDLSKDLVEVVLLHGSQIDARVRHERDLLLTFFGLKTLCSGYLMSVDGRHVERPQHLFMRVALGIHGLDLERAFETYDLMSTKSMIHATPTLFHAGLSKSQNSSCFLLQVESDSIDGIFGTLKSCGRISKHAGGIGLALHCVRGKGSKIRSTNGVSSGTIPMLRMFNAASRYVNQAGKRNGSMAIYLEPWHCDVLDFMELRKNYGNEEQRARDLFTALWVPDLFMRRVEQDGMWSLMSPDQSPGLHKLWGADFERLYEEYESSGRFVRQVKARDVWNRVIESQLETGMPYMLYKDHVNRKSNQQNLGTIQCSNLCTEVMQYTDEKEVAVCNLASLGLPAFVDRALQTFDHPRLHAVTRVAVRNLDLVIDRNYYPVPEAKTSNMRHRPIGVGVQGLADVFVMLDMAFDSPEAAQLNKDIFETMYHAALTESVILAREKGAYESFAGSPASEGRLQFDLWGVDPGCGRYDWKEMKADIALHGLRNSLLLAPMPTASTSQILGYNECFEPFTSNLYKRNTLAGEFILLNRHLVKALEKEAMWTEDTRNKIILANGSVQGIEGIPDRIKVLFKTTWEIKQRTLLDMAAARGPFICQSQSLNLFMDEPDYQKLTAMHFHSWRVGLKTGMYYLRTRPKARAQQVTLEPQQPQQQQARETQENDTERSNRVTQGPDPEPQLQMCLLGGDSCLACSS
jgi:ribonucleoside-diphosphate reductase alpha chain